MNQDSDTIVAIATATGMGGVGIVRVSGSKAFEIAKAITRTSLSPRLAHYGAFKNTENNSVIDYGISLFFKAPHSYTGEDVVEFQAHGGTVVLNMLLKSVMALGARMARAGEFTERAFLNEKMDLAQAEAVADLIASTTEQSAQAAARSLSGAFSNTVNELLNALINIRMHIESALDFPEEEIDFLSDVQLTQKMQSLQLRMNDVTRSVKAGQLLREGMTVVILGQPNAGKSSLLNALTQNDSAIVTDIAGTTRDVLSEHIHIDGLPINLVDTAGLRETDDVVETEGVKRAWQAVERADKILLLMDAQTGFSEEDENILSQLLDKTSKKSTQTPIYVDAVFNKVDLVSSHPNLPDSAKGHISNTLYCSAKTGEGIDELKNWLKQSVGFEQNQESVFTARQRHIDALNNADEHIQTSAVHLQHGTGELAAEELRLAQEQLSSITGEFSSDDLLGEIFSSFCIGK